MCSGGQGAWRVRFIENTVQSGKCCRNLFITVIMQKISREQRLTALQCGRRNKSSSFVVSII